jgi:hypothetical protein
MRLYKEIYRKGLSDFGAPSELARKLIYRLVVNVSPVYIGCDLSELALASISKRLEAGTIIRGRSARHAGLHKRHGRSCM